VITLRVGLSRGDGPLVCTSVGRLSGCTSESCRDTGAAHRSGALRVSVVLTYRIASHAQNDWCAFAGARALMWLRYSPALGCHAERRPEARRVLHRVQLSGNYRPNMYDQRRSRPAAIVFRGVLGIGANARTLREALADIRSLRCLLSNGFAGRLPCRRAGACVGYDARRIHGADAINPAAGSGTRASAHLSCCRILGKARFGLGLCVDSRLAVHSSGGVIGAQLFQGRRILAFSNSVRRWRYAGQAWCQPPPPV
jgi:hypothetical protein